MLLGYTIEPSDELRRFQGQLAELLDRLPPATAFEGAPVPAEVRREGCSVRNRWMVGRGVRLSEAAS